jgi:hypothetical protein
MSAHSALKQLYSSRISNLNLLVAAVAFSCGALAAQEVFANGTAAVIVVNEFQLDAKNVKVTLDEGAGLHSRTISLAEKDLSDGHFYRRAQIQYTVNGRTVHSGICAIRPSNRYWLQVFIRIRTADASNVQFQMDDQSIDATLREDPDDDSPTDVRVTGRVKSVNLKNAPRQVHVRRGDFIDLYWDYYVIPEEIVDDLQTDTAACTEVTKIGVGGTGLYPPGRDRMSSMLFARERGSCTVTVTPKIGGQLQDPVELKVFVHR